MTLEVFSNLYDSLSVSKLEHYKIILKIWVRFSKILELDLSLFVPELDCISTWEESQTDKAFEKSFIFSPVFTFSAPTKGNSMPSCLQTVKLCILIIIIERRSSYTDNKGWSCTTKADEICMRQKQPEKMFFLSGKTVHWNVWHSFWNIAGVHS